MAEPASKKAKPDYTFNVNKCLDKEFETKSLAEIIKAPPSALQGLADHSNPMLAAFKIHTIEDLANWKHAKLAQGIVNLAAVEEAGARAANAEMNFNKGLDKDFETKSLAEIAKAPPSALAGLADWTDDTLAKLHIKTVQQLADWKYVKWAQGLVQLAAFENPDHHS